MGVITNHNKFEYAEFISLKNTAENKGVLLLPGVELSTSDGKNGVHTLIVFSDEWIKGKDDYINQFLSVAFVGKTPSEYGTANGRCSLDIINTIKTLEGFQKDFFLVFAHVEQSSGLWNELGGGKLGELGKDELFQRYALGFQKVRTYDKSDKSIACRTKVKDWIGEAYPAEVEGSDPKSISDIGKGRSSYIKIGSFSYEAVKYALIDHENRLCSDVAPKYKHSHIQRIRFEGGTLKDSTIHFSPELNAFIGVRGSGKSSVLEALRYVLELPVDNNDSDAKYKEELVKRTLGSGGKITLDVVNRHGQLYEIRRILKEKSLVYAAGEQCPGVSICETIIHKPLFFGQKELATSGKGSEKDLIEKLLDTKCNDIRRQIEDQKLKVENVIDKLSKTKNVDELIAEQTTAKLDAEHRLEFYKKHKIEEKLKKQTSFDEDIGKVEKGIKLVENFISDAKEAIEKHEEGLRNYPGHSSAINEEYFKKFNAAFSKIFLNIDSIKAELVKAEEVLATLKQARGSLIAEKEKLADEFAGIKRTLAEELKTSSEQNINAEDYLADKKKLSVAKDELEALSKSKEQKTTLQTELNTALQKLNDLWHQEFQVIKAELEAVSNKNDALIFSVEFKEDKTAFSTFFQNIFKGNNIRATVFQSIVKDYQDFIAVFQDIENVKKSINNPDAFESHFMENLKELLTYQPPNKFTIKYRGVELAYHSLGQRASALILLVLGQRENDVIIIDQPEDDLDNQTIYENVIKLIRELKPSVQFIFATHNPNIPVFGDAEQIHSCSYAGDKIDIKSGGLDDIAQQKRIVDVMEGGKEAFERRKEIYQAWKP